MKNTTNTADARIKNAAKHLAKALTKIGQTDSEMRMRLSNLLAKEMQAVREER